MKEILQSEAILKIKNISAILIPFAFVLYNLIIGLSYQTDWNLTIAWYYFLLLFVKTLLIVNIYKHKEGKKAEIIVYVISFVLLLLLNLALIGPAILLISNKKAVHATKISSIAMATYAFYNVILAFVNLKKKGDENLLRKQLKLVTFINAIVSMMVLENTLINVNGSLEGDMYILSFVTTLLFVMVLLFVTIFSFVKNICKKDVIQ